MPEQLGIYLDHQSATPLRPEVFAAMRPFLDGPTYGNPSSLHEQGLRARDALAQAREQVAKFVGAESPEEILFTSDGTESINLAIKGVAWGSRRPGGHFVASAVEHPAVLESIGFLEKQGFTASRVGVDACGRIDPAAWAESMTEQTILACVHHANYDIGTVQPVARLAAAAAERRVPLLVDAETSAGWLPLNVAEMGAALLAFSPHKLGGPKGVGVLYRHRRARLASLIHGGIQEGGWRAGIENVAGIVGAGLACELAGKRMAESARRVARCQQRLWEGLRTQVPYVRLNGPEPGPERVCASLNLSFEFVEGEGLMLMLDTQGIAVASGTTCVSKALKISPVLKAIGVDHTLAQGSVLFSLSDATTEAEIDAVIALLPRIVTKLRGMSPLWDEFSRGEIDSVIRPRVSRAGP
jgi:cysteine desulfurase